jgi:hypothetical protein
MTDVWLTSLEIKTPQEGYELAINFQTVASANNYWRTQK